MATIKNVLVLCRENACRSQMAEAILNHDLGDQVRAVSAGLQPQSRISQGALDALADAGLPTTGLSPKALEQFRGQSFDLVVTVCDIAKELCPVFPRPTPRMHIPYPDPRGEPLAGFIRVRDEIRESLIPIVRTALEL